MADISPLGELIQRDSALFDEVCSGHAALVGVAVKVLDGSGNRLLQASGPSELCRYVYGIPACRQACRATVSRVRMELPQFQEVSQHGCFSGAQYVVAPIHHETEVIGKVVLGPFLPPEASGPPAAFLEMDRAVDRGRAWNTTRRFPRIEVSFAEDLARNLATTVELMCFISLKNQMTTDMHVESIREAFAELSEQHESLEEKARALHLLDRRLSDVVAAIGRSLRKPLTNVIAHAEMLTQGAFGEVGDDQRAFLETIIDEGEGLLGLASRLEELSIIERGELDLHVSPAPIGELIEWASTFGRRLASAQEVVLSVAGSDQGMPPVRLDAERIRSALRHVIENAVKFTPAGGQINVSARIRVAPGEDGAPVRHLAIEIRDTGIGIAPESHAEVFEPFRTAYVSQHGYSGVGLGLTLASAYIRAHGGEIVLDSTPGVGTVVTLTIPIDEPLAPE